MGLHPLAKREAALAELRHKGLAGG
jgi:hypothetical protein